MQQNVSNNKDLIIKIATINIKYIYVFYMDIYCVIFDINFNIRVNIILNNSFKRDSL